MVDDHRWRSLAGEAWRRLENRLTCEGGWGSLPVPTPPHPTHSLRRRPWEVGRASTWQWPPLPTDKQPLARSTGRRSVPRRRRPPIVFTHLPGEASKMLVQAESDEHFFFSCGNDHWCPPQGGHSACSGGFLPRSHPQKRAMLMGSPWNRSTIYGKTCRAHRRSFGDRSPPVGCHPQSADRPRSQTAAVARRGEPGSCGEPAAAAPPLPACRARSPPPAVTGGGASWPPSPPPELPSPVAFPLPPKPRGSSLTPPPAKG